MTALITSVTWRVYLRTMSLAAVVILVLVATINVAVDPLNVFGSPRLIGFNALKPALDHHREATRWLIARRICPNAGIFGNSRAEVGLDPENPVFTRHGLQAFNHAIAGSGTRTADNQLSWLIAAGCGPKTILLGIDFFDFLGDKEMIGSSRGEPPSAPQLDAAFLAENVFSLTGLRDSLHTVLLQRTQYPGTRTERGFSPLDNYVGEVLKSGHYVLFRQRAQENARNWQRKTPRIAPANGAVSISQHEVETFLSRAVASGSHVHLIIYPYHAQIRLLLARMGLDGLYADWRRYVASLADQRRLGSGSVRVWDFSGISPETLEAIPPRGDRQTQLRYYWEAGHFKKELGDRMIARVFGESDGPGRELNSATIDAWLAQDERRLEVLLNDRGPLVREVDEVLTQIR